MSKEKAAPSHPSVLSLSQHRVLISNDIQNHLRGQYGYLTEAAKSATTSTSTSTYDNFTQILNSMKSSPKVTICRVNLILAPNVDLVLEEINQFLEGSKDDIEPGVPISLCHGEGIFSHRPSRMNSNFPQHFKVVVCDRFCGEAVLRGSNIFVRGVLVADRNIECDDIVCVYSQVSANTDTSSTTRGMALENYKGQCVFLGLGKAACTRAKMFNQSSGLGIIMLNNIMHSSKGQVGDYDVNNTEGKEKFTSKAGPLLPSMNGMMSNKMMLQNLPSILVAHTLNPQPKDVIIDLCCAPGGKTSHAASLVNNDATIIAVDKSRKKMKTVKEFFQDMGASCIIPIVLDSTKCVLDVDENKNQHWTDVKDILSIATYSDDGLLDVKGFYPESFDRIILDPPCSALGLRPKLAVDIKSLKELNKHATYQRRFIRCAVSLLKPGGILVYSTCTINACENEEMVKHILDNYENMKLLPIKIPVGLSGLKGCGLDDEDCLKVRRFDPSDTNADTMGFFIAKFEKMVKRR